MTGPKLNEATRKAGVSSGTRAKAMNVRMSASKVRMVLNHVRGLDVKSADNMLALMQRDAAHDVRKLLASAVANAVNNDSKDADDLYVKACFADEGPTLKRFRPRAKGRAGGIFKRTCHITIVVETMTDAQLAVREAKQSAKGQAKTSGRAARVAASRARAKSAQKPAAEQSESTDNTTTEDAKTESGEEN
ncbi:MAG: ribosomal protein [Actinomycetota bacterium]|jgi:large subunit ribosomal protein L22